MSDESDIDVSNDDVEPNETPEKAAAPGTAGTRKQTNTVKAVLIPGKELDFLRVDNQRVVIDFYEDPEGTIYVNIPQMTKITAQSQPDPIDDYASYPNKYSNCYNEVPKRVKTTSKGPPAKKKTYQCEVEDCGWSFETIQKLGKHKETHTDSGVFACQVCHCIFNHQYNMYHHWRNSCSKLSTKRGDAELGSAEISSLRNFVLCIMGMSDRAQVFHASGGILYLPSKAFLDDPCSVNQFSFLYPCHLCSLFVPTKFIECHGDVHRGRFRIDGRIYNDYYCHICSRIYRKKENLLLHWRYTCQELIAHTPDEVVLDDDELTGLAWLVLQQTIPHVQIEIMGQNSYQMLLRWFQEHSKTKDQTYTTQYYYHFPKEIWPLKNSIKFDIIDDSYPIKEQEHVTVETRKFPVHRVNLLATCSPDFYASGLMWQQLDAPENELSSNMGIYRTILRYEMKDSIINTYKFNYKTCPRLRPESKVYSTEEHSHICKLCDEVKKNRHVLRFASQARLNDHLKRAHTRKLNEADWCVLCHRIMYLRSHEEHWESDCEVIKQFITDPDERKYVDQLFAEFLTRKVFGGTGKLKCTLERPVGLKVGLGNNKRKRDRDAYFMWRGDECYERAESQRDKVQVVITGLEHMESERAKPSVKKAFELAKERYDELRNYQNISPNKNVVIIICPHCAGRLHVDLVLDHMQHRHFYPEGEGMLHSIEGWIKAGCEKPHSFFRELISAGNLDVPPLMSEESYEECLKYNFSNECIPFNVLENDCQNQVTIRPVVLDKPLFVNPNSNKTFNTPIVPAHEIENEHLTLFYPPIEEIPKEELLGGFSDKTWLSGDPNYELPEVKKIDPVTKQQLQDDLAEILDKLNDVFFGDYRRTAHANGINVNSLTDFFYFKSGVKTKKIGELDTDLCMDQMDEFRVARALKDDETLIEEMKRELDDEDDDDVEEEVDGEELPYVSTADNIIEEDEEAEKTRVRVLARERKKQRAEARAAPAPKPYDPNRFAALATKINPEKTDELQYLPSIVYETKNANYKAKDNLPPLPLNKKLESAVSSFRVAGQCTEVLMRNDVPPNGIPSKSIEHLDKKERDASVAYEDVVDSETKLDAVMDSFGNAYIGGFIVPTTFAKHHLEKFYITKDGQAKEMQVFSSKDKEDAFKYIWPVEDTTQISKLNKLKLTRIKLVPIGEHPALPSAQQIEAPPSKNPAPGTKRVEDQDTEMRIEPPKRKRSRQSHPEPQDPSVPGPSSRPD